MKLLLDEQISGKVADLLRGMGHDAIAVADDALRGRSDAAIFGIAQRKTGRSSPTIAGISNPLRAKPRIGRGHHGLVIVPPLRIPKKPSAAWHWPRSCST